MIIAETTDTAVRALPYVSYGKPGRDEYDNAYNELIASFRTQLHQEYLPGFPSEVADLVWGKAYSDGHSSGFYEIENCYNDEADLVKSVLKALNNQ